MRLSSSAKHVLFCTALFLWVVGFCVYTGALRTSQFGDVPRVDPWTEYGSVLTVFLLTIRLLSFLGLPQTAFNLFGLVRFNAFPRDGINQALDVL